MSLFGGGASTSQPAIGSFKVMSQGFGVTVPVIMGTNRPQCVLIDYGDFYSVAHPQSQGGKGGGGGGSNTYSYYATVLLLVCEACGVGVNFKRLWVNKDLYATPDLKGLAEFDGADGQQPWAYMLGKHPDHALPYKGFAYLAAHDYELTGSASIGNHSVEVEGFYATEGVGKDAKIADCITGLLLNDLWGAGFGADRLLSLSQLDDYCSSYGLVISPALTEQTAAKDLVSKWATIANCGMVWTQNAAGDGGALKLLPLSQAAHSDKGYDYVPIAPLDIHLTTDDFLDDGDSDPLVCTHASRSEADNSIEVEFKARSNEYNKLTTPAATDPAAIHLYGLREASPFVADEITLMPVARLVAQNLLQHAQYILNQYEGKLSSWQYSYLEPMDVVTLTHAPLGLLNWPVMIVSVADDGDELSITFEDCPEQVGHAENYAADDVIYQRIPWNTPVGDINPPVIFHAPAALTTGGYEVWVAVSHSDDHYGGCQVWASFSHDNYALVGTLNGQSTCGVLAADFAAGTDPDTDAGHVLLVDLSISNGSLASVSHDDARAFQSLCLAGGEFMAYRDATRVGDNYNLTTPNPTALTVAATAVTSASSLRFDTLYKDSDYYVGGTITGVTGANSGVPRTITAYSNEGGVKTIDCSAFPVLPAIGDTFTLAALPYLRRGLYGTPKGALNRDTFVRCDDRLYQYRFNANDVGRMLYLKFISYNEHGQGRQNLADVSAYAIILTEPPQGGTAAETYYEWINE